MTDENNILILDEHTANRIAAGEVIERPASVVKELVENAIDAGATQIRIALEDGGKELIKVSDNGIGMSREDTVVAIHRHATSKIRSADDLAAIHTLGFRGEAMPSIASVSIMEVVTKQDSDAAGTRLEIEAGAVTNLESVGAPEGTEISVRKLFFNTPARMKFMKSSRTELSHITDLIGRFALAYPQIGFKLTHDEKEIIAVTGAGDLMGAIMAVYGRDTAKQLIPISFELPALNVSGFVSNPSFTRANRTSQVFFVNGRSIRNKTIIHASDHAYRDFIMQQGRHPVLIIFVNIDPELVDVNVHPTKSEVKFSSDRDVHHAVHQSIRKALLGGGAIPTVGPSQTHAHTRAPRETPEYGSLIPPPSEADVDGFREALHRRAETTPSAGSDDPFDWFKSPNQPQSQTEDPVEPSMSVRLRNIRVIGQARNTYILAQCDDGILIIDQHVAHERALFEQLSTERETGKRTLQGLVIPITLELSRREGLVVAERLDDLKKIGFDIEPFGQETYIVRAVPAHTKPGDAEPLLRDIIEELVDVSITRHLVARPEQVLITTACKLAIKAGDSLSMPEMESLIDKLMKTDNPFVCPHGRPIIISLTNWELDRKFKRSPQ